MNDLSCRSERHHSHEARFFVHTCILARRPQPASDAVSRRAVAFDLLPQVKLSQSQLELSIRSFNAQTTLGQVALELSDR